MEKKITPKPKKDTAADRMWKVIRCLRVFTKSDLIRLAGAKFENAKWFLKILRRAGYIKPSNHCGHGATWSLIKDPGPRRPAVNLR